MDFWSVTGFMIVVLFIATVWSYASDALKNYREAKQEERAEKINRHPILTNIVTGLIAWKAFDIWNRSRTGKDDGQTANDGKGRSVYDDLNMK